LGLGLTAGSRQPTTVGCSDRARKQTGRRSRRGRGFGIWILPSPGRESRARMDGPDHTGIFCQLISVWWPCSSVTEDRHGVIRLRGPQVRPRYRDGIGTSRAAHRHRSASHDSHPSNSRTHCGTHSQSLEAVGGICGRLAVAIGYLDWIDQKRGRRERELIVFSVPLYPALLLSLPPPPPPSNSSSSSSLDHLPPTC
jgi:hypothetical protein